MSARTASFRVSGISRSPFRSFPRKQESRTASTDCKALGPAFAGTSGHGFALLHAGEGAAVDLLDVLHAGQRHGDIELVADDLDGARNASLSPGAESVNVGPAAQAGVGAECKCAEQVLAGADTAVEHDLDVRAQCVDDPWQHGD